MTLPPCRYLIYLTGLLVIITTILSCKVLTKQQNSSVVSLGQAMQVSADLPKESVEQYYLIVMENAQILAAAKATSPAIVQQLDSLRIFQRETDSIVAGYAAGYGILKKYTTLLLAITDTSYMHDLQKQKDSFVPAFDTLVSKYNKFNPSDPLPVKSLGDLVKTIVDKIGSLRIRHLQRKYLKALINSADSILPVICDHFQIDSAKNHSRLLTLKNTVTQNFKSFWNILDRQSKVDMYSNYKVYDPIYLTWQNKIDALLTLNKSNSSAFRKIKTAHAQLKKSLNAPSKFKDFFQNVKDLYSDINSIKENYDKLKKDFTPSVNN